MTVPAPASQPTLSTPPARPTPPMRTTPVTRPKSTVAWGAATTTRAASTISATITAGTLTCTDPVTATPLRSRGPEDLPTRTMKRPAALCTDLSSCALSRTVVSKRGNDKNDDPIAAGHAQPAAAAHD